MEFANLAYTILGITPLLAFSAFFSGSETALSALSRIQIQRMRRENQKGSGAVVRLLDDPRRLFITVLFGNTLVNMAFVSITGKLIYDTLFKGQSAVLAYAVAICSQTLILLIFGEITPKTFAIKHAVKLSRIVAPLLWIFSLLIYPILMIFRFFTDILIPFFGVRSIVESRPLTSEEIRASIKATEEDGALSDKEGELLHNIFDLHDTKVREIMVPRTQMLCIDVLNTIHDAYKMAMRAGHSRLPVYRNEIDNICGIFNVKDLPLWKNIKVEGLGKSQIEELTIDDFLAHQDILSALNPELKNTLIRPPFFVFKTRDIGSLMREMNRNKFHMAVVLDEFGGVAGAVTDEDIVEEIVGEIVDEYDTLPDIKIIRDTSDSSSYLVPGVVSLRSVNKKLKLRLDISVADTMSGYITSRIGAIPKTGDVWLDSPNNAEYKVLKMEGTRIGLLKLRLLKKGKKERKTNLFFLVVSLGFIAHFSSSSADTANAALGTASVGLFTFLLLLALSLRAFFAGSETAVVSASKARMDVLAQQDNRRALIIKSLMHEPDRMLGIVLVGTNLMSTAAGVAGLQLVSSALSGHQNLQEMVNTFVMTFIILLFCEILPKTVFRARADDLALRSAIVLRLSAIVLRPIVSFVTKISNLAIRFVGDEDQKERKRIMREELKLLAQMGEAEGALKKAQLRMIHSILDLESRTVEKIMTPLVDIVAVPMDIQKQNFLERVSETGFSRIPIFKDRIDNMIGLVNVLDVLYSEDPSSSISPFIRRDIRHEPKTKRIFPLLRELAGSHNPMVFIVDEYGGIVGLVTIEDLVGEIMGDIRDERDTDEEENVRRISENVFECAGKAEVQTLNQVYGLNIPGGSYSTIAGYVVEKMQKIPKKGESVETENMKILILDADTRRVKFVRILLKP